MRRKITVVKKIFMLFIALSFLLCGCGESEETKEYLKGYTAQDISNNIALVAKAEEIDCVEIYQTSGLNESVSYAKSDSETLLLRWQQACAKMNPVISSCDGIHYPNIGGLPMQIVFWADGERYCIGMYNGGALYTPLENNTAGMVTISEESAKEVRTLIDEMFEEQ